MYPSTMMAFNVSKQTKLCTVLGIEGFQPQFEIKGKQKKVIHDPVNEFFTHISAPTENAVWLSEKYFNLMNYATMLRMFNERKTA